MAIKKNEIIMLPGQQKEKASNHEDYLTRKKAQAKIEEKVQAHKAALSSTAIEQTMKLELERLKAERLKGSFTYAQVAEEFNIYLRTFKEYVSGKRKPGKGEAATRYGLALEKYYLNTDINRWFVRDDYQA